MMYLCSELQELCNKLSDVGVSQSMRKGMMIELASLVRRKEIKSQLISNAREQINTQ
jgi:hypothetical protein